MRLLLSSTPAFGHLLPLVPFARAAIQAGHSVGVLTAEDMRAFVAAELPGAEFLAAGVSAPVIIGTAAQEDGVDLANVTVEGEAAMFGRVRVKLGIEASLTAAAAWQPDAVICEAFDRIGPIVAGAQHVPWFQFGIGPGAPEENAAAVRTAALPFAEEREILVRDPVAYLEPCPPSLKPADWTIAAPVIPIRTEPFTSVRGAADVPKLAKQAPAVLVTLGTIFSDPDALTAIVSAIAETGYDVLATEGLLLSEANANTRAAGHDNQVQWVAFEPLADLLEPVDAVLSAGGSGTVLAAAAVGKPLVLFPQGADQYYVATVAEQSGIAVTVSDVSAIPAAVETVLGDSTVADAVRSVRDEIMLMPLAADAVSAVVDRLNATAS